MRHNNVSFTIKIHIMKNTIILILLAGFLQTAMTQVRIFPVFNSDISGRSINVLASGQIKDRHEFGGGLRFHINKYAQNDDQNNIFAKRMYATKPIHFFGLEGFYQVHLFQKLPHIDIFAFYDIQVSYSTTRNRFYSPAGINADSNGIISNGDDLLYKLYKRTFGPFTWIEQNIGIGFTVDIWKNIFFTQRLGAGTTFILGRDTRKPDTPLLWKPPFEYEFGYLLSVGIGYRFEPKKK